MSNCGCQRVGDFVLHSGRGKFEAPLYYLPLGQTKVEPWCDECKTETEFLPLFDVIEQDGYALQHAIEVYECQVCGGLVAYEYPMEAITADG